jgi:hypothetical protein
MKLSYWNKVRKKYPVGFEKFKDKLQELGYNLSSCNDDIEETLDSLGVRCFIGYNNHNGCFKPEIRKSKEGTWKMDRVGMINCYTHRKEAREAVYEKALELLSN